MLPTLIEYPTKDAFISLQLFIRNGVNYRVTMMIPWTSVHPHFLTIIFHFLRCVYLTNQTNTLNLHNGTLLNQQSSVS